MPWVKHKLRGAQAKLFAAVCHHYINAAEDECNDTPDCIPIFSGLSPNQRLQLVSEVMIGMLCEDEPFPPATIQHKATYRAIIQILFIQLEVEEDSVWPDDISEELMDFIKQEHQEWKRKEIDMNKAQNANGTTSENGNGDKEEYSADIKSKLIDYRAEKNRKKLREGHQKINEELHVSDSGEERIEHMRKEIGKMAALFEGGPVDRATSYQPANDEERHAFYWRLLCDAALQEDFNLPLPLSMVNFDWRCSITSKWYRSLNLLLDTTKIRIESATESALLSFTLDAQAYANPENFPRIMAIEKHTKILQQVFEFSFDPSKLALPQRCIFAVCSNERYGGVGHTPFVHAFIAKCEESGVDFKEVGNYQRRLDIFRAMQDDYVEGLNNPFGAYRPNEDSPLRNPSEYKASDVGVEFVSCFGPGDGKYDFKFCINRQDLKACSRCKVALYCSAECQRKDWKRHKKVCATLAAERKNKQKIAEMAKKCYSV